MGGWGVEELSGDEMKMRRRKKKKRKKGGGTGGYLYESGKSETKR